MTAGYGVLKQMKEGTNERTIFLKAFLHRHLDLVRWNGGYKTIPVHPSASHCRFETRHRNAPTSNSGACVEAIFFIAVPYVWNICNKNDTTELTCRFDATSGSLVSRYCSTTIWQRDWMKCLYLGDSHGLSGTQLCQSIRSIIVTYNLRHLSSELPYVLCDTVRS